MIRTGLVSITFRKRTPAEIVNLVAKSGLAGIEWGGDVHVPHGDLVRARETARMTADAGLRVAAYGSYYRLGQEEALPFESVLETAVELGAPLIRVWAGCRGSADADHAYRQMAVLESRRIGELAAAAGITIAYEFHGNTLTDTADSAVDLLKQVNHPNIKSCWQPAVNRTVEERLEDLRKVLPWLTNVHVFQWNSPGQRNPLSDGTAEWKQYLDVIRSTNRTHDALIEFVQGDDPEAYLRDAETLREWMKG